MFYCADDPVNLQPTQDELEFSAEMENQVERYFSHRRWLNSLAKGKRVNLQKNEFLRWMNVNMGGPGEWIDPLLSQAAKNLYLALCASVARNLETSVLRIIALALLVMTACARAFAALIKAFTPCPDPGKTLRASPHRPGAPSLSAA